MAAALAGSVAVHAGLLVAIYELPGGVQAAATFAAPLELNLRPVAAAAPAPSAGRAEAARKPRRGSALGEPVYYEAHELEHRPQVASHVEPAFPALALAPIGEVAVEVYVNEQGTVDRVAVESDDPNGAFAVAASQAFAAAHFVPGRRAGRPVKARLRIQVRFGSPHPDNTAL